jgi:hypothetical protein
MSSKKQDKVYRKLGPSWRSSYQPGISNKRRLSGTAQYHTKLERMESIIMLAVLKTMKIISALIKLHIETFEFRLTKCFLLRFSVTIKNCWYLAK